MTKRKPVLSESDFWLPKPAALGWRGLSLLIPALASALGFFCFAVLAFSFTELETLPQAFRSALVVVGAFSLAFGSEIGTLSNVIEIYRKGDQRQTWDWIGLAVSLIATCAAFVLAFAALLGVNATWGVTVRLYGPIVLGILAALDSYGGFMEFGLYLNTHDARMHDWQAQYRQAVIEALETERESAQAATELAQVRAELAQIRTETPPLATESAPVRLSKPQFRAAIAALNGQLAPLVAELRAPEANRAEVVNTWLQARGYEQLPPSTARDWALTVLEIAEAAHA